MSANEMWIANKYIKEPVGDGGNPRIPTLKVKNAAGVETLVNDNDAKVEIFASTFFPPPPPAENPSLGYKCTEPLPDPPSITKDQI